MTFLEKHHCLSQRNCHSLICHKNLMSCMCVCVQYNKLIIYVAISQQSITLIILQILPLLNINKLTVLKVFQTLSTFHPLGVTEAVYRQTSFQTLQLSVCVCLSILLAPACLLPPVYCVQPLLLRTYCEEPSLAVDSTTA